jgi:hypothetical protein
MRSRTEDIASWSDLPETGWLPQPVHLFEERQSGTTNAFLLPAIRAVMAASGPDRGVA